MSWRLAIAAVRLAIDTSVKSQGISQSTIDSPGMWMKSRVLCVTIVKFRTNATEALSKSIPPTVTP